MNKFLITRGAILCALIPACLVPLLAQSTGTSISGTVRGKVFDKNSRPVAPLGEIRVDIVNKRTGQRRAIVTNKGDTKPQYKGEFVFTLLPVGEYFVCVNCTDQQKSFNCYGADKVTVEISTETPVELPPAYLSKSRAGALCRFQISRLQNASPPYYLGALLPTMAIGWGGDVIFPAITAQASLPAQTSIEPPILHKVNISTASRGGVLSSDKLALLPLPGIRTVEMLAFLFPGVTPPPQTLSRTAGPGIGSGVGTSGQFAVNGLRSRANNFTIDGSDNNDEDIGVRRQGFTAVMPQTVESIEQYHIGTLLPMPQLGRNFGAQVNIVSRTGAPQFHGALYGFYTNDRFRARDAFDLTGGPSNYPIRRGTVPVFLITANNPGGEELAPSNPVGQEDAFDRRQFGFVLSGPLGKPDCLAKSSSSVGVVSAKTHTLFFLSSEYQRIKQTKESHFAVPTLAERGLFKSGDTGFSNVLGLSSFFPTSGDGDAIFSFFPFPNNDVGPYGKNTFTQVLPANAHGLVSSLRLDRAFNSDAGGSLTKPIRSHAVSGRYNFADDDTMLPVTGGALFSSLRAQTRAQNVAFFYNGVFKPNLVNELRSSYGRTSLNFLESPNPLLGGLDDDRLPLLLPSVKFPPLGFNDKQFLLNARKVFNGTLPTFPCIPAVGSPIGNNGQPCLYSDQHLDVEDTVGPVGQIIVSGFSPVGVDVFNFPQRRANNTIQVADTLFYNPGTHRITAGLDLRRTQLNSRLERNFRPLLVFSGAAVQASNPGALPCPNRYCLGLDFAAMGAPTGAFQTYGVTRNADIEPDPTIGLRYWQTDFFASDELHPLPNLSLTIGTRYQYSTVPSEVNGRIESTFNSLEVGNFIEQEKLLNQGVSGFEKFLADRKQIFNADKNNLAPYFAFAWDPIGEGSTVIRGGYGIYFDQIPGAVTSQARNVFPNFLTVNLAGVRDPNRGRPNDLLIHNPANLVAPTLNTFKNIADSGACPNSRNDLVAFLRCLNGLSLFTQSGTNQQQYPGGPGFVLPNADLPTSYSQQWALTIEHEWKANFFASIAYVGTRGIHLLRFATPNLGPNGIPVVTGVRQGPPQSAGGPPGSQVLQGYVAPPKFGRPFPFLGSYTSIEADTSSTYHSFQAELNKRLSGGIQFTTAYTWSHAIDEVSDLFELASGPVLPQDSFNRTAERASASFDIRHNFAFSVVWDLSEVAKNRRSLKLLKGWQLASIGTFRTGQPFSLLACCDVNLDGNLSDRLNTAQGIDVTDDGAKRFTVPKFDDQFKLLAAAGNNGFLGRNTFRAPGVAVIDLAVSKKFTIQDWHTLELRTEFFNLFNRTHFGIPVHQQGFAAFGQSVDTRLPGLTVQFALKYSF